MTQRSDAQNRRNTKCIELLKERYGSRLDVMATDEGMREPHARSIHRNDMSHVEFSRAVVAAFGKNPAAQIEGLKVVLALHAVNLASAEITPIGRKEEQAPAAAYAVA